jgi:hypothetical protein
MEAHPRARSTVVEEAAMIELDLNESEYDDSPWTQEELEALAWGAGKEAGWEDMEEYDEIPEKP